MGYFRLGKQGFMSAQRCQSPAVAINKKSYSKNTKKPATSDSSLDLFKLYQNAVSLILHLEYKLSF